MSDNADPNYEVKVEKAISEKYVYSLPIPLNDLILQHVPLLLHPSSSMALQVNG